MPRLSLPAVLGSALLATFIVLSGQKAGLWMQPEPASRVDLAATEAADTSGLEGPPATSSELPPQELNPVPAGTPEPTAPAEAPGVPSSALPVAPSGEPAAPAERRSVGEPAGAPRPEAPQGVPPDSSTPVRDYGEPQRRALPPQPGHAEVPSPAGPRPTENPGGLTEGVFSGQSSPIQPNPAEEVRGGREEQHGDQPSPSTGGATPGQAGTR